MFYKFKSEYLGLKNINNFQTTLVVKLIRNYLLYCTTYYLGWDIALLVDFHILIENWNHIQILISYKNQTRRVIIHPFNYYCKLKYRHFKFPDFFSCLFKENSLVYLILNNRHRLIIISKLVEYYLIWNKALNIINSSFWI